MTKENWVSFPDVTDKTGGEIMLGDTGMPAGLELDRLQLPVNTLRRAVIGWGGYEAMTLAAYHGGADQYSYGAGGIDAGGGGYATGAFSVSKAESSRPELSSDINKNINDARNGVLGIQWNIDALNGRLQTHEQYDPGVRARQLDAEIRKMAIAGISRHNVTEVLRDRSVISSTICLMTDTITYLSPLATEILQQDLAAAGVETTSRVALMLIVVRTARALVNSVRLDEAITDPLLMSMRPTRAAISAGLLATHKLVRAV